MRGVFVGIHAALVAILALLGLSFLADPCGGGGDLCLGGALGLGTLGVAAFGAAGIVIWWAAHRASPLLVFDSTLTVVGGYSILEAGGSGPTLFRLGTFLITVVGVAGTFLAGRAVAAHRVERLLALAALVGVVVLGGAGGSVAVLILGLLALGLGLVSRGGEGSQLP